MPDMLSGNLFIGNALLFFINNNGLLLTESENLIVAIVAQLIASRKSADVGDLERFAVESLRMSLSTFHFFN